MLAGMSGPWPNTASESNRSTYRVDTTWSVLIVKASLRIQDLPLSSILPLTDIFEQQEFMLGGSVHGACCDTDKPVCNGFRHIQPLMSLTREELLSLMSFIITNTTNTNNYFLHNPNSTISLSKKLWMNGNFHGLSRVRVAKPTV